MLKVKITCLVDHELLAWRLKSISGICKKRQEMEESPNKSITETAQENIDKLFCWFSFCSDEHHHHLVCCGPHFSDPAEFTNTPSYCLKVISRGHSPSYFSERPCKQITTEFGNKRNPIVNGRRRRGTNWVPCKGQSCRSTRDETAFLSLFTSVIVVPRT